MDRCSTSKPLIQTTICTMAITTPTTRDVATRSISNQAALNLVMDTLRCWVEEYQIDGFRFVLAATLRRRGDEFRKEAAFSQPLQKIRSCAK